MRLFSVCSDQLYLILTQSCNEDSSLIAARSQSSRGLTRLLWTNRRTHHLYIVSLHNYWFASSLQSVSVRRSYISLYVECYLLYACVNLSECVSEMIYALHSTSLMRASPSLGGSLSDRFTLSILSPLTTLLRRYTKKYSSDVMRVSISLLYYNLYSRLRWHVNCIAKRNEYCLVSYMWYIVYLMTIVLLAMWYSPLFSRIIYICLDVVRRSFALDSIYTNISAPILEIIRWRDLMCRVIVEAAKC